MKQTLPVPTEVVQQLAEYFSLLSEPMRLRLLHSLRDEEKCVQELVEAEEPDHIAAEAADVLYFVMTRCVAGGVGIKDIEKHLDQRSAKVTRRPGLTKDWRTEAAENCLKNPSSK